MEMLDNPTNNNNKFITINKFIEITGKGDKELTEFINRYLFPKKSELKTWEINKNIDIIKEMNSTQQALVKGRAKSFEEINDPSKSFPTIIAIWGIIISLYAVIREMSGGAIWVYLVSVLIISFLAIYTIKKFVKVMEIRATAVFFNTLLNSIKFDGK